MNKLNVSCTVNGDLLDFDVAPNRSLLDALRTEMGLTGTKKGCDVGECGSCTILFNGRPANACLILAAEAQGAEITTVEGLQGADGKLHPLQECFMQCGAAQCGFCTPGMLMSAEAMLRENPRPTREEINRNMSGNLCRCTGYKKIVEAIEDVIAKGVYEK